MKTNTIHPFRKYVAFAFLMAWLLVSLANAETTTAKSGADYVNPMIGTNGHGHTYPGATVPFGMVQLSPDAGTRGWDWCSGYHYSDTAIVGFSHTHLSGTGCADLGDILVTPMIGMPKPNELYGQEFVHENERVSPGFYSVTFSKSHIQALLTASARVGYHRYVFPETDAATIVFDLGYGNDDTPLETHLDILNDTTLQGYRYSSGWATNQKIYFYAVFATLVKRATISTDGSPFAAGKTATAKTLKTAFQFEKANVIELKVAISPVSMEGAKMNLLAEIPGWNFSQVSSDAHTEWNKELSGISVDGTNEADKTAFYSAYYHTLLAPTLFCDVDGSYRGPDDRIHHSGSFKNYCTFSLWDTYRAAHPLYTLVQPDRVPDMVNSMLAFQQQNSVLPVWSLAGCETWCMIGYHAVPVIADAYLKGFTGFDPKAAFKAMKASALDDRRGLSFYNRILPEPLAVKLKALHKRDVVIPDSFRDHVKAPVLHGYAKAISGETIRYKSYYPYVNDALLTRATDGKKVVEWETQPVPQQLKQESVSFMWVAGLATGKGGHRFDLLVNDERWFTFTTARDTTQRCWNVKSANGATLTFLPAREDVFHDLFGEMFLTVPAKILPKGKALRLKVIGENGDSPDWYMTFQHEPQDTLRIEPEYALAKEDSAEFQIFRAYLEYTGASTVAQIRLGDLPEQTVAVHPGLTVVDLPIRAVTTERKDVVSLTCGNWVQSSEASIKPLVPINYIPADKERESVSKALEYAYDDWCIAQTAKALGETADYKYFSSRAGYWKNLYDPQSGFMRGKNFDGSWVTPFDPTFTTEKQPEFTEGNSWQYSWYVPQDVPGLMETMGGKKLFCAKLDQLFNQKVNMDGTSALPDVTGLIGIYAHGNEPSHHIAYLYNEAGEPWKTQQLARRIMREFYTDKADGLCGNEDCGQMSAWYVFSAIGFYPLNPANGMYSIGSPLFTKSRITTSGNKTFTVEAPKVSEQNIYIQSARLNGQPLNVPEISHAEIVKGGTLELEMGPEPNKNWGSKVDIK